MRHPQFRHGSPNVLVYLLEQDSVPLQNEKKACRRLILFIWLSSVDCSRSHRGCSGPSGQSQQALGRARPSTRGRTAEDPIQVVCMCLQRIIHYSDSLYMYGWTLRSTVPPGEVVHGAFNTYSGSNGLPSSAFQTSRCLFVGPSQLSHSPSSAGGLVGDHGPSRQRRQ